MVREEVVAGDLPLYAVPGWRERFGVVAGVTGRGLDLGLWTRDPVVEVMNRWRAFRRSEPGLPATVLGTQVHGPAVAWHDAPAAGWLQVDGVDGHGTVAAGARLCVTIADCIPIYLVAPRQGAVALLHSGWRGTAAGILARGVELLVARTGARAPELVMHCGVGICGACYEVGREVMDGCGAAAAGPGPWHLDLRERLAEQGSALGIGEITVSGWCSAHDREQFYSHRASAGCDGRMVAYLGRPT